jgi:uncharacterized protein YeaO (DUF488 family)
MSRQAQVQVRRVYDAPESDDGARVLVDRIWPRGLTKTRAALHEWCKTVAPSTKLCKWYSHDPARFAEFTRRYQVELAEPERSNALAHLRELAAEQRLTLLTATKQPEISEAQVLAELLRRRSAAAGPMSDQLQQCHVRTGCRGEHEGAMP